MRCACGHYVEGEICLGREAGLLPAPRRGTQFFKDFSGRESVPDRMRLIL